MSDSDKTPIDLDEHDRIDAAMTPGPWTSRPIIERYGWSSDIESCEAVWAEIDGPGAKAIVQCATVEEDQDTRNAAGIVLIRNDHAALLAELRAARETLHALADELGVGYLATDAIAACRKLKALAGVGPMGGGIDERVEALVKRETALVAVVRVIAEADPDDAISSLKVYGEPDADGYTAQYIVDAARALLLATKERT